MSDNKRPDFTEFHEAPDPNAQKEQAKRCNNCGVPFCQAGTMIAGMASGCPLNNLVPETNSLVSIGNCFLISALSSSPGLHIAGEVFPVFP